MKVEFKVKLGFNEVQVILEGHALMVERLTEAVKKAAKDYSNDTQIG